MDLPHRVYFLKADDWYQGPPHIEMWSASIRGDMRWTLQLHSVKQADRAALLRLCTSPQRLCSDLYTSTMGSAEAEAVATMCTSPKIGVPVVATFQYFMLRDVALMYGSPTQVVGMVGFHTIGQDFLGKRTGAVEVLVQLLDTGGDDDLGRRETLSAEEQREIAFEALRIAIDYGFHRLSVDEVSLSTWAGNETLMMVLKEDLGLRHATITPDCHGNNVGCVIEKALWFERMRTW
jgi:hypothetical protein